MFYLIWDMVHFLKVKSQSQSVCRWVFKVILDSFKLCVSFILFLLLLYLALSSPHNLWLLSCCRIHWRVWTECAVVCCSPLLVHLRLVALSSLSGCLLMTAFVKPTARLFLGSAVNRQIPHPRLEMFSALCRALVCTGVKNRTARVVRWKRARDGQKREEGERWR